MYKTLLFAAALGFGLAVTAALVILKDPTPAADTTPGQAEAVVAGDQAVAAASAGADTVAPEVAVGLDLSEVPSAPDTTNAVGAAAPPAANTATAPTAPAPGPSAADLKAKVVGLFDKGEVEAAAILARATEQTLLASDIDSFRRELTEAQNAKIAKNSGKAIAHYQAAETLNRRISSRTNVHEAEIRKALTALRLDENSQSAPAAAAPPSKKALVDALKNNPNDEAVKSQIRRLDSQARAGTEKSDRRSKAGRPSSATPAVAPPRNTAQAISRAAKAPAPPTDKTASPKQAEPPTKVSAPEPKAATRPKSVSQSIEDAFEGL